MKKSQYIKLFLDLLPTIIEAIRQMEVLFDGSKRGEEKHDAIKGVITSVVASELALKSPEGSDTHELQLISLIIDGIINTLVGVMNRGEFGSRTSDERPSLNTLPNV